jgi:hypothetical protein
MEQQPSRVEILKQQVFEEDYLEAHTIDWHFSLLRSDLGPDNRKQLLSTAIMSAHDSLVSRSIPGSEEFGYETAMYAWRWLRYRQAHLQDTQPLYMELDRDIELHDNETTDIKHRHGLDEEFDSYKEKFTFYAGQLDDARQQLLQRTPVFFETFADLEAERTRHERESEGAFVVEPFVLDPFTIEKEFAVRSLCRALDRIMVQEGEECNGLPSICVLESDDPPHPNTIKVVRQAFERGRVEYELEEAIAVQDEEEESETVLQLSKYTINRLPDAVQISLVSDGTEKSADTLELLLLAAEMNEAIDLRPER